MVYPLPRMFAQGAAGLVALVAAVVGAGWGFGIDALISWRPDWPRMSPITAVAFFSTAASLWLLVAVEGDAPDATGNGFRRRMAQMLAAGVAGLGLWRLADYGFGWNLNWDTLGLREVLTDGASPARMSPATASEFFLLGVALLIGSRERAGARFQIPALAAAVMSLVGLLRYLYGGMPLVSFSKMAFLTAAGCLLLSLGILCARPASGVMALVLSPGTGGMLMRRLLPPAFGLPLLLAWLRLKGEEAGWFGPEAGLALFALLIFIFFAALIWTTARMLQRLERAQDRTNLRLQASLREVVDLRAALDEHAIVAITDARGRITFVNDKFCTISQFSRKELLGQDHRIINSGHHPPEFFRELWSTIGSGCVWHGEIRNRAKDGSEYWVDTTIMPFLDARGKPRQYVAIRADITERKRAEETILRLNEELEERVAQRTAELLEANKELEAFSYSVSHDLRAPLRAVDGFSQAVLEDYGGSLPEEGRRYLRTIRDGAQQMGALIDDLLAFSRLSRAPLNRRTVDVGEMVLGIFEDFRAEREGRQIDLRLGTLPPCVGDAALLKQVWINLLSNALKYTRKREIAVVEVGWKDDAYFVRDNGTGFDMRYTDKLFGVFQRLHRAEDYEGTGVGLALAQRIIHRHGGRIRADAAVDAGATFSFTLNPKTMP